jgi:hypothetical protein
MSAGMTQVTATGTTSAIVTAVRAMPGHPPMSCAVTNCARTTRGKIATQVMAIRAMRGTGSPNVRLELPYSR